MGFAWYIENAYDYFIWVECLFVMYMSFIVYINTKILYTSRLDGYMYNMHLYNMLGNIMANLDRLKWK